MLVDLIGVRSESDDPVRFGSFGMNNEGDGVGDGDGADDGGDGKRDGN